MIHIDRSRVPVPPSLLDAGVKERERATAFYADPGNQSNSFPFKAYKADDVVAALEQLFRGKCAYCESSYAQTQPADIEHFRPKGAVMIERPGERPHRRKPGYYWLAAEWDNLLPSCIDCNRARTQDFPDDDLRLVRGKENRFPRPARRPPRVSGGRPDPRARGQRARPHDDRRACAAAQGAEGGPARPA
jgi:hypothetical protein